MARRRPVVDQRLQRGQRRLIPGSLEGRSEQAQPPPSRPTGSVHKADADEVAQWSQSGAVEVTAANNDPVHDVQRAFDTLVLVGRVRVAGSTATIFTVYLDGVSIGTCTIAASSKRGTATINNVGADAGDGLSSRVTTAGTGAFSASLKARMRSS